MSAASFTARLDAIPLNAFHWKLLVTSGLGWMFDAMDVILISFLLAPIAKDFSLEPAQRGIVVSAGFVGMFVGAAVSGRLADRYGRRGVFQTTLLIFCAGSVLSAIAPTYESLLLARVVTGLGLGGELPVASTLVSELSPRASRGRMVSLLESFWAYGTLAAGLIAIIAVPVIGWRGAFVIGAVPALYVAYLRRALPESPRYLAAQGRPNEADAVVRSVERAGGAPLITVARAVAPTPVAPAQQRAVGLGALWAGVFARRTAMLWILWAGIVFTFYGAFTYIPSVLVARGLTVSQSNTYFFLSTIAQVPGYFSAAWLIERWGRKPTLVTYLLGSAAAAYLFGNAGTGTDAFVYVSLLSFFNLGAWAVVYSVTPELYPTAIRAGGAGTAASVGRLFGIVGPFLTPVLVASWGQAAVFALFMAILVVIALDVLVLGEETKGRSLEELGQARLSPAT